MLAMIQGDNVLTPQGLRLLMDIHKKVGGLTTPDGKVYADLCTTVPTTDGLLERRRRRRRRRDAASQSESDAGLGNESVQYKEYDYDYYNSYDEGLYDEPDVFDDDDEYASLEEFEEGMARFDDLNPDVYCDVVGSLEKKCLHVSLLELWRFSEARIMSLTTREILDAVNGRTFSPWFRQEFDYANLLGGATRNGSGHIVAATAAEMIWYVTVPENATTVDSLGGGVELQFADQTTLDWEQAFVDLLEGLRHDVFTVKHYATREFGETSIDTLFFDGYLLCLGYAVMLLYTTAMLGRWNWTEFRYYLTVGGMACIFQGTLVAFGLTSAFGIPYTPMHPILSFLVLGIGIDDMFVIMQYHKNVREADEYKGLTKKEQVAMALRQSGVTLTITTVTDILVFTVCAYSSMSSIKAFSLCSLIALLTIYMLQVRGASALASWTFDRHNEEFI